jgi:hypothetical protein
MARLLSINVGLPNDIAWHGQTVPYGSVEACCCGPAPAAAAEGLVSVIGEECA